MTGRRTVLLDLDGTLIDFPRRWDLPQIHMASLRFLEKRLREAGFLPGLKRRLGKRVGHENGVSDAPDRLRVAWRLTWALKDAHARLRRERANEGQGGAPFDHDALESTIAQRWSHLVGEALKVRFPGRAELAAWIDFANGTSRDFYALEFAQACRPIEPLPAVVAMVQRLRARGFSLVLATNPLTPLDGVRARLANTGLAPSDFVHITHADNSCYLKPHPRYYTDLLKALACDPKAVAFLGNHPVKDGVASTLGIPTFLLCARAARTRAQVNPGDCPAVGLFEDWLLRIKE